MRDTFRIYTQHNAYKAPVDKERCRAHVHDGYGVGFHQCSRKASVFEDVQHHDGTVEKMGFCKTHSSQGINKRNNAFEQKLKREVRLDEIKYSLQNLGRRTMDLLSDPQFDKNDIPEDIKHWVDEYKKLIKERKKLLKEKG